MMQWSTAQIPAFWNKPCCHGLPHWHSLTAGAPHQHSLCCRFSCSVVTQTQLITSPICFLKLSCNSVWTAAPFLPQVLDPVCSPFLMLWQSFVLHESPALPVCCEAWWKTLPSGVVELCTVWVSCTAESLFALSWWKNVHQVSAQLPLLGLQCWPTFPGSDMAWPHQLGPGKGKVPVKVCRSPLLCDLFCVFWWGTRLHLYKKNNCVLFQTSFWCLLTSRWLQKGTLCHGLG